MRGADTDNSNIRGRKEGNWKEENFLLRDGMGRGGNEKMGKGKEEWTRRGGIPIEGRSLPH